ncbi:DUF4113 domain-containing protein [Salinibacter altiplanensis]|uniref:DUF4113 domain-containing protein n=1 Tax=Salinibacter altiplanensis TaxID=1803181 RepID=UPI001E6286DA|nr:DUF4113 domain-containing protein [Salinibacter altiplanensis]
MVIPRNWYYSLRLLVLAHPLCCLLPVDPVIALIDCQAFYVSCEETLREHGVTTAAGLPGERDWTMTRDHTSPRYTTRWDELPVVTA